ncbi:MAG: universal stress protein [Bdellovibrionia bacterium]
MKFLIEISKVIWAVDPFAENVRLQRSAAWAISKLSQETGSTVIQPIYLTNDWSREGIVPQRWNRSFIEKIEAFGNDSLKDITDKIPLKNINPLQVISRPYESIEQGAGELLHSARIQGGNLIVASTRAGKGGGGPFALPGSFVETLSNLSGLPLLVVNPKWKHATGISSIVFPSDLSQESFEWFKRTLEFAKTTTAKVTLFHKTDFPLSQPFETAVRVFPEIRDSLFRRVKASQIEAKRWAAVAEKSGVRLSVVIDSKMVGSLSEAVITCVEKHPGSVVVAPPLSASYPRSTIRKLMSRSPFPMLLVPTPVRADMRTLDFSKVT